MHRIVSLLPGATEWVVQWGALEVLLGRSHECNYPPLVRDVPVVTSSTLDGNGSSEEIDDQVREHLSKGLSIYNVDIDRIKQLYPDIILTQSQCEVCAVSEDQLQAALGDLLDGQVELFSFAPSTFKQVLEQALALAQRLSCCQEAMSFLAEKEKELQQLKNEIATVEPPTVLAIEWMDPLMVAGHWTPDLIRHAGGTAVLTESGAPSSYISWKDVESADPDYIFLMPCGYTLSNTRTHLNELLDRPEWKDLRAVRNGDVYAFNGDAYFNRPGPRLYRSIELLAYALHGVIREGSQPGQSEMARVKFGTKAAVSP